ncbi:acetylxylan esterase [Psychroserpens sp. SPM9]|uniref:acetylxylan esterase n=1 Tax=Psychroserpens sp. SPM9 TaxID=2975598 RepID=UPI0021A4BC97|nr:acetylxylan esterase [Psychroserpens sp. SPM9]MDG5491109.1 acetylxylan esterase [Psychroserpens sp. SPM9]
MNLNKCILILFTCVFISCYVPQQKPDDFEVFWQDTLEELNASPIASEAVRDTIVNDKKWTLHKINSFQGIYFYAWVSEPQTDKTYPIKIKFSRLGPGNTNPNVVPHIWFLKESQTINMVVDIRGQGISTEQIEFKGYLTKGLKDKNNYIYRGAFMDAVRSVDFISQHPKSDGNIIVEGENQGGALSIVTTALNPKVTMTTIGFPLLTDMYSYDKEVWPMKIFIHEAKLNEIDLDELHHTLSYFDMLNFADKIETPLFLRTQEADTITPKETSIKFFNAIKSTQKEMYIEDCNGHGCSSNSEKANQLERAFIEANLRS